MNLYEHITGSENLVLCTEFISHSATQKVYLFKYFFYQIKLLWSGIIILWFDSDFLSCNSKQTSFRKQGTGRQEIFRPVWLSALRKENFEIWIKREVKDTKILNFSFYSQFWSPFFFQFLSNQTEEKTSLCTCVFFLSIFFPSNQK